jgi:sulfatase maturation enzyme AslB (radical SAM superfamily)
MLAGGEPMLMKQNYKLFKHAPDDCKFSIVTNLSYNLESLPCIEDLIKRPKDNVIWTISADNTHEQFEYVRNGASWDQLVKNIKLLTHYWPHTVGLNIVYSILSATEVNHTYRTFSDLGLHKVSLLQLVKNNELSIDRMPESIKKLCADRLLQLIDFHQNKFGIDQHLYPIKGIETIYENLTTTNKQNIISKDLFNKKIDSFDRHSASKSFKLLWPELSHLLNQELT